MKPEFGQNMNRMLKGLYPHEFHALLEAIRRDMRVQLNLSNTHPQESNRHKFLARSDQRLLEVLNPKGCPQDDGESTACTRQRR
jgi:hypothetical protein